MPHVAEMVQCLMTIYKHDISNMMNMNFSFGIGDDDANYIMPASFDIRRAMMRNGSSPHFIYIYQKANANYSCRNSAGIPHFVSSAN